MSITLYSRIAEELARRVADGTYPVGDPMPGENALAEEFDASRQTVRAALRQLQDLGLIARRRGIGTIVTAERQKAGFSQSLSSLEDLVQLAARTPRTLKHAREVVMDVEQAGRMGVRPGTRWLCLSSTRGEEGRPPMVWTDLYVDAHYKGIRKLAQQHPDRLVSDLIEERYGRRIASVEQVISGCAIPDAVAKELGVPGQSPGLLILRQYKDLAGSVIETSESYHPADRYRFSMTLIRDR
ncbi:GntR family transcriptional regulator [Achromobacter aloeverae]|uniref:GntR family transcriptional regulator n=1 Tax=Achromobacter aloeverae TaxID=1750518 RepID=A0A4V1MS22_9BURK|nr:GntR family transcriptional regulator [Achromobacter aloeverae]RXN87970.1 GntR family transcriptional regulator [Achromobacter aloeverae]